MTAAEAEWPMRPPHQAGEGGSIPTPRLFRKEEWEVRPVDLGLAQAMVEREHYSRGGSNTAVLTCGLFPRGAVWDAECSGVSWWLPPTKNAAMKAAELAGKGRQMWEGVLALSRLVVLPGVPSNACSYLIRHSTRFIDRSRWPILLTFADEWQGHGGKIYLAAGWKPAGTTKPERTYLLNGRMVSRKAGPKTRTHREMLALGAVCVGKHRKKRFIHAV